MSTANWFLAHKRMDDDADINHWCDKLTKALSQDGWSAKVTAGRDDYDSRAKSLGGWKAWGRDVPRARTFDGEMLFHGIIVPAPCTDFTPFVGKSTAQLVQGFLDQQKHAYTWCSFTGDFRLIKAVKECGNYDYKQWAQLDLLIPDDYRENYITDEDAEELGLDDDPEWRATEALKGFEAAGFDTTQVVPDMYDPFGYEDYERNMSRYKRRR